MGISSVAQTGAGGSVSSLGPVVVTTGISSVAPTGAGAATEANFRDARSLRKEPAGEIFRAENG